MLFTPVKAGKSPVPERGVNPMFLSITQLYVVVPTVLTVENTTACVVSP